MKNTLQVKKAAVAVSMALLAAGQAQSAVTQVGSQGAFSALGTIVQNTNFDLNGGDFTEPGSPVTYGALTFTAGGVSMIGGINANGMARSLFTDGEIAGTTISIEGNYSLFALNAGNFFEAAGPAIFDITTNLVNYSFEQMVSSAVDLGSLTFVGFQAGAGEYFTSVRWHGESATGVTEVQLGITTAVPEPETYAMMLAGLGLLGFAARRRKAKAAAA